MTQSYKAVIFATEREVWGYDDHGNLVLATGERFKIAPLHVEPETFRSYKLRAISRLAFTGGEWWLDGERLETCWVPQFSSPPSSERDTKIFTCWTLRDILAENRHDRLNDEYPPPSELQNKVCAVAWVEERFMDYAGQTRDPNETPRKAEFEGEILNMVAAESAPAKAFQPIFLTSFYEILSGPKSPSHSIATNQVGDPVRRGVGAPATSASTIVSGRHFRVALSFPGEHRDFVASVAAELAARLGQKSVFYDEFYEADLARPELDLYLGKIYREQSDLVVPFYSIEYERKKWCKLEWRYMRDILLNLEGHRIMPFRFDDSPISGVLSTDGYIKIENRSAKEVAELILERLGEPRSYSTLIDSFPELNRNDAVVLNTACELLMEGTDPGCRLQSELVFERASLTGLPKDLFQESIEILDSRHYIKGTKVFRGTIPFFVVSTSTFEKYVRKRIDRYDALVTQVSIEVVKNEAKNSRAIAVQLSQREVIVAHILDEMEVHNLIRLARLFQGPRVITYVSAELKRRLRES